MTYPNVERWSALADGRRVPVGDGRHYLLSVVDRGSLVMPAGRLGVCDPLFQLEYGGESFFAVPPGRYRVRATLADVSDANDGSHIRVAYASLMLDESAEEVMRRNIVPPVDGTLPPELGGDEVLGFGVDSGTACFVDVGAIPDSLRHNFWKRVFNNGRPNGGLRLMRSEKHLREGLANIPLLNAPGGGNIIAFGSGWGDGTYPVVGGYDASGRLVRVHVDFFVVSSFPRAREPIVGRALRAVRRVARRLRPSRGSGPVRSTPRHLPGPGETASNPVLPLRDEVVLPGTAVALFVGRARSIASVERAIADDTHILLAAQKNASDDDPALDSIHAAGTLGIVLESSYLSDGTMMVQVKGLRRAEIRRWLVQPDWYQAEVIIAAEAADEDTAALARAAFNAFVTYVRLGDPPVEREEGEPALLADLQEIEQLTDPGVLADRIATYPRLSTDEMQDILATTAVSERLRKLLNLLEREIAVGH